MTPEQRKIHTLLLGRSCVGCAYLYKHDQGYSNYTVTETEVHCALNMNENLKSNTMQAPWDWNLDPDNDNWPPTNRSRCHMYEPGPLVTLDVEQEDAPQGLDHIVTLTIYEHANYHPRLREEEQ